MTRRPSARRCVKLALLRWVRRKFKGVLRRYLGDAIRGPSPATRREMNAL